MSTKTLPIPFTSRIGNAIDARSTASKLLFGILIMITGTLLWCTIQILWRIVYFDYVCYVFVVIITSCTGNIGTTKDINITNNIDGTNMNTSTTCTTSISNFLESNTNSNIDNTTWSSSSICKFLCSSTSGNINCSFCCLFNNYIDKYCCLFNTSANGLFLPNIDENLWRDKPSKPLWKSLYGALNTSEVFH